jgi:predicted nucleic acid-binding protein
VEPAIDHPGQEDEARVVSLLLDTNILVDYIRRAPVAIAWLRSLPESPSVSVISLLELYAGARSQREERDVEAVCAPLRCLTITAEHHGLRLATLNVRHFPMFPKLKRAY